MKRLSVQILVLLAVSAIAAAQPPAGRGGAQTPGAPTPGGGQGAGPGGGRGGRGGGPAGPARDTGGRGAADAPRGTAVIRGLVVAADTGAPIRRAQVRASAPGARTNRLATTDPQGRFELKDLPAGRYTVSASKGGFVSLQYGQRRPSESGTPLEIADGQVLEKLGIALPRGSVIAGRVTDEFGEPIVNASVSAARFGYSNGARRLIPNAGRDTTDDLGQFRLFGLQPGEYIVSASYRVGGGEVTDPAGEVTGYAPTYYPGTPNAGEAQRLRIDVGQEQTGIAFALVATRLVRLNGSVLNSQGVPATTGSVMLMSADRNVPMRLELGAGRIGANGTFTIANVAPGRYLLQTRAMPQPVPSPAGRGDQPAINREALAAAAEIGRLEIAVGAEDVNGIVIVTAPGARVSGVVGFDRSNVTNVTPNQVQVSARAAAPDQMSGPGVANASARLAADWTFQLSGIFDPRLFRVNAPGGWQLKQVLLNGQDITDTPLEFALGQAVSGVQIVLTDKLTTLSGRISDTRGAGVSDVTVIVFPADERLWIAMSRHVRSARPDQEGRFQWSGLPVYNNYLVAMVQSVEDGQVGDPEFLTSLKNQATSISLGEGESKAIELKVNR